MLQAQALLTGLQMVAGIGVVVDILVEQQGTCAVLASAVDVLQGHDQTQALVGCDLELAQTWEYQLWRDVVGRDSSSLAQVLAQELLPAQIVEPAGEGVQQN